MQNTLLGGQTPHAFMRAHWQKRPLLVRRALPGFRGVIARRALERLAARDDVESRLIECSRNRWRVTHGPLTRTRLARAGSTDWTLLVQGLNLHLEAADRLLRRFAFLPQARLDDVMVSYAAPGGGVGPHADSYDVFLLQGEGRRVWRLARPRDWVFAADAPLKLIEDFRADDEYLLEPGDMLYLPPGWGHEGVALEPCFTYSIGFRAPQGAELAAAFLDWLHARGLPDARYRDPGLKPATRSAHVPAHLATAANAMLARLRWSKRDVAEFLGEYLTTPKPHVVFMRPSRALAPGAFARRAARADAVLDLRTQLLYRGARFYINGEAFTPPAAARRALETRADTRRVPARRLARGAAAALVYDWYRLGYVHLERAT